MSTSDVTVCMYEDGENVVATASGSLNIDGLQGVVSTQVRELLFPINEVRLSQTSTINRPDETFLFSMGTSGASPNGRQFKDNTREIFKFDIGSHLDEGSEVWTRHTGAGVEASGEVYFSFYSFNGNLALQISDTYNSDNPIAGSVIVRLRSFGDLGLTDDVTTMTWDVGAGLQTVRFITSKNGDCSITAGPAPSVPNPPTPPTPAPSPSDPPSEPVSKCETITLLYGDPDLSAANSNMGYAPPGIMDKYVCSSDASTLVLSCTSNPELMERFQEAESYVQACEGAGGTPAKQEVRIQCAGQDSSSLSVVADMFQLPACTYVGCESSTNLVPYVASYERAWERIQGTNCMSTVLKTFIEDQSNSDVSGSKTKGVSQQSFLLYTVYTLMIFLVTN